MPLRVRALVLSRDRLFIAGPPDLVPADDPLTAIEGRRGAALWSVSATDGKRLAEFELDALPVFDGLIAANGYLFLTTQDGKVCCFAGTQP